MSFPNIKVSEHTIYAGKSIRAVHCVEDKCSIHFNGAFNEVVCKKDSDCYKFLSQKVKAFKNT